MYVQKVKAFCYKIDVTIKKFVTGQDFIEKSKSDVKKRVNRFNGWRLFVLFILACVALVIPVALISLFTDFPVWYAIPIVAAIITFSVKIYYQKKVVPIHNDAHKQLISTTQKEIDSAAVELCEFKAVYETETDKIPDNLRHQFVFDILGEAIRQGYASDLQEAICFYRNQLDYIEQDETEAALKIQQEILESEKDADTRLKVFDIID